MFVMWSYSHTIIAVADINMILCIVLCDSTVFVLTIHHTYNKGTLTLVIAVININS